MKTSILIVTCEKHAQYTRICLRSIEKFARDFESVVLVLPGNVPCPVTSKAISEYRGSVPLCVNAEAEWHDKGMLWHMWMIMRADEICSGSDFVLHMDSDCYFNDHLTPLDYFTNNKPQLIYASFEWLCQQQANIRNWQIAAERCLGFPVPNEMMRRHPAVHYLKVYAKAREVIEAHVHQPTGDYMRSQRNEFPQGFAEFPTLGAVAWKYFMDDYYWINQEKDPWPNNKMCQMWSHAAPTPEQVKELTRLGLMNEI